MTIHVHSIWIKNDRDVELEIADVHWIIEKAREFQKKKSTFASLTRLKYLTGLEHNKLWKICKVMGIPNHLTCLLRNFYVRSRTYRTMDWFKIGRVVRQGCILSPCLLNLYAKYIMWNPGQDELQAGIKTGRRNNNTSDMQMMSP